ncbi:MAG TPA: chromosome segregation protein SMC, partial [Halanaerobiales bacterium]|nr:chromosome segregation protein SMC [Halanaerobiales bacterium]
QARYDKLESKYEEIQDELYQKKSRREFIEDLKKEYSGFYKGVKNILKEKDRFPQMYGAVAELINVSKKYETAIETTLGSKLQNVVVENDKTAQQCIEYLKENKSGRATFLPIQSLKTYGRINTTQFEQKTGYLGLALDFVSFKDKFQKVMEYLLASTIISKDLDSAIEISNIINKKYKLVTLEGDVIYPGGSVSGGSRQSKKNNLLGREREVNELEDEIAELDEQIDEIVKEGLDIKDKIEKLEDNRDELKDKYQKLKLKLENLKENEEELKDQLAEVKDEVNTIQDKIEEGVNELTSLKDKKSNLSGVFDKNSQNYDEEKDIINQKQEKIDKLNDDIENLREKLTDVRVKFATQQEKLKSLSKDINNLEDSIEQNKNNQENKETRIEEIKKEVNDLAERKVKLLDQKEEFENEVEEAAQKLEEMEQNLKQMRAEHEKLENEVEELNDELNEKKDKLHEINIDYTRKKDKSESIEERLINEYNFDINHDQYEEREKVENRQQVEQRVKELREQISKLGSVNIGAIEEYEELKERLDYLHEQQSDLEEAKESIINIIERIDETMMDKFKTTFYQIKEEFEEVFVELFNGGRAELNLVDEEALLDTGVEIIAQPPGKKLKKLTLLSGGERALTAIALVFALLRVNPSPFYILDEIDAPLDDVNVVRFSDFLKEYTDFAQFIVVTHRKHMMTAVDNIYGLTMTDKGVTELVSLNLKEQIQ